MTLEQCRQLVVLYAEDEPLTRSICEDLLSQYFKSVITCSNGEEGIEKFSALTPDIIITDLAMPITDGFAFIQHVRNISNDIPIVVTTAYREEAKKAENINGILFKPLKIDDLLNIIEQINIP